MSNDIEEKLTDANNLVRELGIELATYRNANRKFQDGDLVVMTCSGCAEGVNNPIENSHYGVWEVSRYNAEIEDYFLERPDYYPRDYSFSPSGIRYLTYLRDKNLTLATDDKVERDRKTLRTRVEAHELKFGKFANLIWPENFNNWAEEAAKA